MKRENPFPGMNPYMEQKWRDVHSKLIAHISEALGTDLPDNYTALAEEAVDVKGGHSERYHPDVSITADSWKGGLPPVWQPETAGGGVLTLAEPIVYLSPEPPERWVEVRLDDGTLVTVIEVLSPTNKTTGRHAFTIKRRDYLAAGVNLVEIDLLRGGERLIDIPPADYARRIATGDHYTVSINRAYWPERREVYPCPLRDPLPHIRIPLKLPDPDVRLALQPLIDRIYTSGRYWKLDYSLPLEPAPSPADAEWIAERVDAAR